MTPSLWYVNSLAFRNRVIFTNFGSEVVWWVQFDVMLVVGMGFGRSKLRHMLQMSNLYRVQLILGKAKESDMHAECAILYGKVKCSSFTSDGRVYACV